jgi:AcrR family transcriptional regulator
MVLNSAAHRVAKPVEHSGAPPGLARRPDPEERRRQILEAAIAYLAECGFAGQTRELSRRIGITQPLLYR